MAGVFCPILFGTPAQPIVQNYHIIAVHHKLAVYMPLCEYQPSSVTFELGTPSGTCNNQSWHFLSSRGRDLSLADGSS